MSYETLTETEWEDVNGVYDLLEKGEVERARRRLQGLMQKRPDHPDLLIVDAAVCLDEGDPGRALAALKGAERSADPSLFFHLRAVAHFEMAQLEQARDDAGRALAIQPDLADVHELLSRIHEHLGENEQAEEHAAEAQVLEPEVFGPPLDVSDEEFDALVEQAVGKLPDEVRRHLDEVPVLVEALPRREILTAEDPPLSPDLLGLFVGRHLLERSHTDVPGVPGAIFLFRRNLLRACGDREELEREVRITVQHEVGHLLGLDEDDLDRWGLA